MCLSTLNTRHTYKCLKAHHIHTYKCRHIDVVHVLTHIQVPEDTSYINMLRILQGPPVMAPAVEPPEGEPTTPVSEVILACSLCLHMPHVNLKHTMIMMLVFDVCAAALQTLFCVGGCSPCQIVEIDSDEGERQEEQEEQPWYYNEEGEEEALEEEEAEEEAEEEQQQQQPPEELPSGSACIHCMHAMHTLHICLCCHVRHLDASRY